MERITTAEAAARLGVSQTQVRRLGAAGRLRSETETRPQGSRILVLWDEVDDATQTPPDAPNVATAVATTDATHTPAIVSLLEDEVRDLRARLTRAEEDRAELRRMLNLEQQTVLSLIRQLPEGRTDSARQDAPASPPETPPPTPPQEPPIGRVRRPWYAFWARGGE